MTAQEFLQIKGLLDKDKIEFIITLEDGRKFELCELLKEYSRHSSIEEDRIREANESNYS